MFKEMFRPTSKKEKPLEDKNEADQLEKRKREQSEMGEKMFDQLKIAVESNQVFNIMSDGKQAESVGPMKVSKIENNGNRFTINVDIVAPKAMQGFYPVYEFNVDLGNEGQEIHAFKCPYGPDNFYGRQALELFIEKYTREVSEFRLYPDKKE
jgi:hypothetical protein